MRRPKNAYRGRTMANRLECDPVDVKKINQLSENFPLTEIQKNSMRPWPLSMRADSPADLEGLKYHAYQSGTHNCCPSISTMTKKRGLTGMGRKKAEEMVILSQRARRR